MTAPTSRPFRETRRTETEEDGVDVGLAWLLRRLSDLLGRSESVHLTYSPSGHDEIRWTVWLGAPAGTGGAQWGAGTTPREALQSAYEQAVGSIFAGRVDVGADDG
jgi:hypothetical protein